MPNMNLPVPVVSQSQAQVQVKESINVCCFSPLCCHTETKNSKIDHCSVIYEPLCLYLLYCSKMDEDLLASVGISYSMAQKSSA